MLRRQTPFSLSFFLLTAVALFPLAFTPAVNADQWTNLTGTSTVSGEMLGLWNGRVLLQLDGGRRVSVKMEDLRAESRIQAEKRFAEIQQRLQQRLEEIRSIAEEAEAPAPQESAAPPAAPSYDPPDPDADLRTTLLAIRDQTLAGHARVFYDTLPESHQKLVDDLAAVGLTKIDTASFESARASLASIADLVISRQRWLLSHPVVSQLPETQQEGLLHLAELVRTLTADDVLSLDTLRSRPLSESIAALDDAVSPYLYRLLTEQAVGQMVSAINIEVSPGSNGSMVANFVLPIVGSVDSANFTRVEGRWVAGENAEAAAKRWQELQQTIDAVADGSLRLPVSAESLIQQLGTAAAALAQAPTQQEFHRTLDGLLPGFVQAVNAWADYQPPRVAGSANPYGTGDEYYSEIETPYEGESEETPYESESTVP